MPQNCERRSAESSGAGESFSESKIEAIAVAIVTTGTLRSAAEKIGCDESTLRVWRQVPKILARVRLLRVALNDERLAQLRTHEREIDGLLLEIIRDKSAAPTARVNAIKEFRESLAQLKDRAGIDDNSAETIDETFARLGGTQLQRR